VPTTAPCGALPPYKQWVRCEKCGLVRVDPMPAPEALRDYYDSFSRDAQPMRAGSLWRALLGADELCRHLLGYQNQGRLLEIGSGWGAFLATAAYHGWEAVGLETSAHRADWSREHLHTTVIHGTAPNDLPEGPFDAVVMCEVIEHAADPRALLRAVHERLATGGTLLLSTPCLDHPYHIAHENDDPMWGVPSHLVYFDRMTLRAVLKEELFVIAEQWFSPSHYGSVGTLARRGWESTTDLDHP
jgi:SAM-dependent methyltransferase